MRIAMILSGGVGNRFGSTIPKQYTMLRGKMVIDYAIDACRQSKLTDKIVIVATGEYVDKLHEKYGVDTCEGGKERNNSVKNGIDYIAQRYRCEKIVFVDAVSPLTSSEQIDKYFCLLNNYDIIQTATKVTSSIDRYDGVKVMRNDFYQTLEPEAYNFDMLYQNFDGNSPSTTVYHQMPKEAKKYACFDYPYNMKLTYNFDLDIAGILLDEINKQKEKIILERTLKWISTIDKDKAEKWIIDVWSYFSILEKRWEIISYTINPLSFTGLVIEANSTKYGDVIVKFDPAVVGRYIGEKFFYQNAGKSFMTELLDYDDDYCALLLKKVVPGKQVYFNLDDKKLRVFFDRVSSDFVPISSQEHPELKTVMSNFMEYAMLASKHVFEKELREELESYSCRLWNKYFIDAPEVILHMDLHYRNILDGNNDYKGIDCQGVIGPYEFEYTRMFVINSKDDRENAVEVCNSMFEFCKKYTSEKKLKVALFIEWVFLMDEFVFADDDNYEAAKWALNMIMKLFNIDRDLIKSNNDFLQLL